MSAAIITADPRDCTVMAIAVSYTLLLNNNISMRINSRSFSLPHTHIDTNVNGGSSAFNLLVPCNYLCRSILLPAWAGGDHVTWTLERSKGGCNVFFTCDYNCLWLSSALCLGKMMTLCLDKNLKDSSSRQYRESQNLQFSELWRLIIIDVAPGLACLSCALNWCANQSLCTFPNISLCCSSHNPVENSVIFFLHWNRFGEMILLTNISSAVNGCRQNESPNSW